MDEGIEGDSVLDVHAWFSDEYGSWKTIWT